MNNPLWALSEIKNRENKEGEREFRLEKWKKQQASSLKMRDEKRKGELMREEEEAASNKQRWLTITTCRGCLPGGRELVNYC